MSKVRIADTLLDISCQDTAFFDKRLAEYRTEDPAEPAMRITSRWEDPVLLPSGAEEVMVRDSVRLLALPNGTFCRAQIHSQSGRVLQTITFDKEYSFTDIRLLASRRNRVFSLTDFEYMYTGSAFSDHLTRHGGLVLHGSAMAYRGNGLVFTANSGTGKSTHTGLWRERFGDDVIMINDDKPAIRFNTDGSPLLFGTPWSGKTDLNHNFSAPLKAIVVLEQAPVNEIRPLTVVEAAFHLTSQTNRPYYDAENGIRSLDAVEKLLTRCPCYLLRCTISQEAVSLVYTTVFGKETEI